MAVGPNLFLSYSVGPVHGLQVFHGVPVMLHKNDGISPCQIQTKATCMKKKRGTDLKMRGGFSKSTKADTVMMLQNAKP